MGRVDRVAGEGGDDDLFLFYRVPADETLVKGRLAVGDAVGGIDGGVPAGNPEGGGPAALDDIRFGDDLPVAGLLYLEAYLSRLALLERVELGVELQDLVLDRIEGEADDIFTFDLGDAQQRLPALLLFPAGVFLLGLFPGFVLRCGDRAGRQQE